MAYFLRDCRERLLGCLLFDPAARRLPCRDAWIGWQDEPYHAHLQTGAKVVSVVSVQVTCNYQGPFDENIRPRTPYVEICEMQYTVY